ncbi:MAG TPA: cyclase family protein [Nitrososphaera sp.]|nr:cyclase family protein [Nitrososphaera sp.]
MRVVDLTMRITPSIRVFPGSPQPSFVPWSRFDSHGYDSEAMFMSTHTGTHIDAPSHFVPGLTSIDRIPARRLVCNAVLVRAPKHANQLIEQEDVSKEEIKEGESVVIATGWERRSSKHNYMTENPGLSAGAARYLARKKVNAVAIDGPSIDAGIDTKFTAHNILLLRNILAVENLCNVDKIATRNSRFTLVLSPLKLGGATGSPARVFAILGDPLNSEG